MAVLSNSTKTLEEVKTNSIDLILAYPQESIPSLRSATWTNNHEYQAVLDRFASDFKQLYRILHSEGSMWFFCDNIRLKNEVIEFPFDVGTIGQKNEFILRNIITWYRVKPFIPGCRLQDRYTSILFFVKDFKQYKFDKDPLRVEHFWKKKEWGGGRTTHYHPKGKDPGNVWIIRDPKKEEDSQNHILLSFKRILRNLIDASTHEDSRILDPYNHDEIRDICETKKRTVVRNSTKFVVKVVNKNTSHEAKLPIVKKAISIQKCPTSTIFYKTSEDMDKIPDETIQMVVTSPPYWNLRDYNNPGQIGFADGYDSYIKRLTQVWKECYRVLVPTGSIWVNIKAIMNRGDLNQIPNDICKSLKTIGFYLQDLIVWHKTSSREGLNARNVVLNSEHILWCTKSEDEYYFNQKFELDEPDYFIPEIDSSRFMGNVWKMSRNVGSIRKEIKAFFKARKITHTAVYPIELVRRVISLCSRPNDIILDPFMGSGTTAVESERLKRKWVGYEINEEYQALIYKRLEQPSANKRLERPSKTLDDFLR